MIPAQSIGCVPARARARDFPPLRSSSRSRAGARLRFVASRKHFFVLDCCLSRKLRRQANMPPIMRINRKKHGIERNQNPIPAKICGWRSLVKTRSVAGGPRAVALKQQALSFGSLVLYFDATVPSRVQTGGLLTDLADGLSGNGMNFSNKI